MAEFPGSNDVHVDALLTNISVGYKNLAYLAERLFPVVLVQKRSDIIPKFRKSDWFRDQAKELTEREAAPVGGYNVDLDDTYYCREYGMGHFISDARRANTDTPLDADRYGTEFVTDKLLLRKERQFASKFWKTGVWGTDKSGGVDFTKWSEYATSHPITDLRAYVRAVRQATGGLNPNKLVLGDLVFDTLADHPDILERIKYGAGAAAPATVTPNLIAQLVGVETVEVGLSMYTASPMGTDESSVVYTPNWGNSALLMFVAPRPSLFTPSAGYTFVWSTVLGGPRYIKRRRDPESDKGWLVEGYEFYDQCGVAPDAGLFMYEAAEEGV